MNGKEITSNVDCSKFKGEYEKYETGICLHCGRCPTCGRKLRPTPHGWDSCHPRVKYIDGIGLLVETD